MVQVLIDLLLREAAAAETVAARTRALELIAAAGERRFIAMALDELETASQRLSGLEVTRSLAACTAGLPADVTAIELTTAVLDDEQRVLFERAVHQLRQSTDRLRDARDRATAAIGRQAASGRTRLQAAQTLAAV